MNMKRIFALLVLGCMVSFSPAVAQTPEVVMLTSGTKTSLRGLSVVNESVIWVSGSNGTVGRSANGGKTWKWMVVKGFEKTDFRDVEAFDGSNAIIMGVDSPAYILKTTDGGESWKVVYENKTKGMFLDAMDFVSGAEGVVVGDPIDGKIFMARTTDGGNSWKEWDMSLARPDSGEAFFAASGSNIRLFLNKKFYLVSGGKKSRLYTAGGVADLPVMQGKETTGANAIAVYDRGLMKGSDRFVIVGGDFGADSSVIKNCFYSNNGGKTWQSPRTPPHGYRSCVEFLSTKDLLSCGLNGVDYSYNGGRDWKWISREGFHVCRIARIGSAIFLAGGNGKVAKITWK